jgi:hypothetical protein
MIDEVMVTISVKRGDYYADSVNSFFFPTFKDAGTFITSYSKCSTVQGCDVEVTVQSFANKETLSHRKAILEYEYLSTDKKRVWHEIAAVVREKNPEAEWVGGEDLWIKYDKSFDNMPKGIREVAIEINHEQN